MFSKVIKEIVRGKIFFCSFILFYVPILWWAVLSGRSIAIRAAWIMTFWLGVVIVIVGIVTSIDACQSHSWSRVRAKLTKYDIKRNSDSDGTTYELSIMYQFKIGDRNYRGTNYDFSDFAGSLASAERKIESLKQLVDEEGYINVFYKPSDPELNVICPGIHPIHGIRLVFGLALMVLSLLTLWEIIQC
ncbi:MAG: DUF3592 domain-containing protein [Pleurocapsa sp.]